MERKNNVITPQVFKELFYSLFSRLYAFSLKYVKDEYAAEEIVENAMLILWEKREKFDQINDIKSYLYSVVRNASIAYLKKNKQLVPFDLTIHDSQGNPDRHIIEEEVHAALIEALDTLPKKCKQIFELSCIEGLKYKDIAQDMKISVNTVKSQRSRAIELLRKALKDYPLLLFLILKLYKFCDLF